MNCRDGPNSGSFRSSVVQTAEYNDGTKVIRSGDLASASTTLGSSPSALNPNAPLEEGEHSKVLRVKKVKQKEPCESRRTADSEKLNKTEVTHMNTWMPLTAASMLLGSS